MNAPAAPPVLPQLRAYDSAVENAIAAVHQLGGIIERMGDLEAAQYVTGMSVELTKLRRDEVKEEMDRQRMQRARGA